MLTYTYDIEKVFTIPQKGAFSNVVNRIIWTIKFFDDEEPEIFSVGGIDTVLNTDNIVAVNFIPFHALTKTKLLEFAHAAESPETHLQRILPFHAGRLDYIKKTQGEVETDFSTLAD